MSVFLCRFANSTSFSAASSVNSQRPKLKQMSAFTQQTPTVCIALYTHIHQTPRQFVSRLYSVHTHCVMQGRSENERRGVGFDASVFDGMINSQTEAHLSYLTDCRSHRLRTYKPRPAESDDVIITSSPNAPPRPQMKLLQFHSNVRPPYFGSWRKKSEVVSGRAPFRMDKVKIQRMEKNFDASCETYLHKYCG